MPEQLTIFSPASLQVSVLNFHEDLDQMIQTVDLRESEKEMFNSFSSEKRKKEFLAARFILKNKLGVDMQIIYDSFGKPTLPSGYISISHSGNIVGVSLSNHNTALDIEQFGNKVHRIKHKFLSDTELALFSADTELLHASWCIKECIFKLDGKGKIDFKNEIQIQSINAENTLSKVSFRQKQFNVHVRLTNKAALAFL